MNINTPIATKLTPTPQLVIQNVYTDLSENLKKKTVESLILGNLRTHGHSVYKVTLSLKVEREREREREREAKSNWVKPVK